ncbi:MAG: FUN14 domain-containing protein [Chromatiaceae bacterium]|nr:FUN14 domain-containing protein [Chromatiaceae bacterium]MBP6735053.1 FUN14 domain-containing protein [Chromatiaceae bacterium]MBP8284513.1 FUN14 domain-containing protein [Chromatiaceae bacterium]MBP8288873.1 FUN14 domain-containing protein [Chromatiaceae bacterium]MBP9603809.1 FUN14 domain-containing protein [Chromatiaceae bacterium]
MRPLTLVGSALGLAGAVAASSHLARQSEGPALATPAHGRPLTETFPADLGADILVPPASESALPFPPAGVARGQAADPALFSPEHLLNLGFSFIVGLAVGFAFKIAFKIALVGGGLLLIALFALQHAGFIGINWSGMEAGYDSFAAWFGAYAGGLQDFMSKNLSNAASFTAGILLGLKI